VDGCDEDGEKISGAAGVSGSGWSSTDLIGSTEV
jgi:hypothetical protein